MKKIIGLSHPHLGETGKADIHVFFRSAEKAGFSFFR